MQSHIHSYVSMPTTYLVFNVIDDCSSVLSKLLHVSTNSRARRSRAKWLVTGQQRAVMSKTTAADESSKARICSLYLQVVVSMIRVGRIQHPIHFGARNMLLKVPRIATTWPTVLYPNPSYNSTASGEAITKLILP